MARQEVHEECLQMGLSCLTILAVAAAGRTPQANRACALPNRKMTKAYALCLRPCEARGDRSLSDLSDRTKTGSQRMQHALWRAALALEAAAVTATLSERICDASIHCGAGEAFL